MPTIRQHEQALRTCTIKATTRNSTPKPAVRVVMPPTELGTPLIAILELEPCFSPLSCTLSRSRAASCGCGQAKRQRPQQQWRGQQHCRNSASRKTSPSTAAPVDRVITVPWAAASEPELVPPMPPS